MESTSVGTPVKVHVVAVGDGMGGFGTGGGEAGRRTVQRVVLGHPRNIE